jgi:hypothetical protein
MAGPVRDGTGGPWESAAGSPSPPSLVSSLSEMSAGASPSPDRDDTGAGRQDPISPSDERQIIKPSPQSAPAALHSFASTEPHRPYYRRQTNSMSNPSTSPSPPCAVGPLHASSSNLSSEALSRSPENAPTKGTREPAEHDAVLRPILAEHEVLEAHIDDQSKPVPEVQSDGRDTRDDGAGSSRGPPFRIEWIRTTPLPFFRTWHLRNPWNRGREVKVSRDGTELEPDVGQRLLDEWDIPHLSLDSSPGPSQTPERRRGSKSTNHPSQFLPN